MDGETQGKSISQVFFTELPDILWGQNPGKVQRFESTIKSPVSRFPGFVVDSNHLPEPLPNIMLQFILFIQIKILIHKKYHSKI